jgi:hypothetical protein
MNGMNVYVVGVNREDEGRDTETLVVGIYRDEFVARRVAADYRLQDDEWITVGEWPVFETAFTIGDEDAPAEVGVVYERNGWQEQPTG